MISRIKIAQTDYFTVVCSVARSPANFSKASETVFLPIKPKQSLKPYDYRAVYTHIPNMNRSSSSLLVQEVSGVYHFSVFRHRRLKMALRARKLSGAFETRAPGHERAACQLHERAPWKRQVSVGGRGQTGPQLVTSKPGQLPQLLRFPFLLFLVIINILKRKLTLGHCLSHQFFMDFASVMGIALARPYLLRKDDSPSLPRLQSVKNKPRKQTFVHSLSKNYVVKSKRAGSSVFLRFGAMASNCCYTILLFLLL